MSSISIPPAAPLPPGTLAPQATFQDPAIARALATLSRAAQTNPKALLRDRGLADVIRQLRGLKRRLGHSARRIRGARRARMLRRRHRLLQRLGGRLRRHFNRPKSMGQAAKTRYGESYGQEVDKIMRSNMTLEEKFMMLASLISTKLEGEIQDNMSKWSQELSEKGGKQGTGGKLKSLLKKGLSTLCAAVAGPLGAAGAELLTGASNSKQQSGNQAKIYETRTQMLIQRLGRLQSTISNVMAASHSTKMQVIRNIRS